MSRSHRAFSVCAIFSFSVFCSAIPASAANLTILLPLHRVAYQTNEWIDVSVVRSDTAALASGNLTLTAVGDDGGKIVLTFPAKAVALDARATEHLHLNGRLLRPGKYTLEAACDGATATTKIEVYSHIRQSDFKLIDWGSSTNGPEQTVVGENSMGFNLIFYTHLSPDDMIRGGADFMRNCTMSGGHQMDLRSECDWSDPYVLQGGEARVVAEAMQSRTLPNCAGVHFYDEPGLTWWKDPKTDAFVPFNIPSQDRSYASAFGIAPPHWTDVKPDDAASVARWNHMNRWKESFIEAAWKYAAFGVSQVRPDLLSATQSQYGWMAYADGYYFNAARQLPVISGHGGYDDGPATYMWPSFFHEMGRIRDVNKPIWYMPMWFNETPDQYRLEQYLSFMTGLQGMSKPPGMAVQNPDKTPEAAGIVESNKLMARLGTIFTTMPPTRGPVAMLYSLSQDLGAEVRVMQDHSKINDAAYEGGDHVRVKMLATYLAGKMNHTPYWPIVEEDVLDGSLAANHRAVIVAGIDYLDARVVTALEAYIAGGGAVIVTDDSKVQIKGATKLGAEAPVKLYHQISELWAKDQKKSAQLRRVEYWLAEVAPYATALQTQLAKLGVKPALDADSPSIITQRQAQGDIEYLFAVNATPKADDEKVRIQSAEVKLSLPADGRPVYDAIHGGLEPAIVPAGDHLQGKMWFGPGQMRVFARTARPIGGVQVATPVLVNDLTLPDAPIHLEATALLVDDGRKMLSGSVPLQIRLIDPLGQVRYDLYRATDHGILRLTLPMAANDPAGTWTLTVQELLDNQVGSAKFDYQPALQCAAVAGATQRAVYFGNDRENIFRLFRTQHDFTIVVGKGDYDAAAARIAESLKPWGAECKIVKAADVTINHPSDEALKTWSGLGFGKVDPKNLTAALVGFDLRGPVIMLGTPTDNELIKFADEHGFLPYKSNAAGFPGRGRGYISWQRDAVNYGGESVALIGYDPAGISEAIGTFYEAVAGIEPLTKYDLPALATITPAKTRTTPSEMKVAWSVILRDRVAAITFRDKMLLAASEDGTETTVSGDGKVLALTRTGSQSFAPSANPDVKGLEKVLLPGRIVKKITTNAGTTAIAYWGGTLQCVDKTGTTTSLQMLPSDISDVVWFDNHLVVGLADGDLLSLQPR